MMGERIGVDVRTSAAPPEAVSKPSRHSALPPALRTSLIELCAKVPVANASGRICGWPNTYRSPLPISRAKPRRSIRPPRGAAGCGLSRRRMSSSRVAEPTSERRQTGDSHDVPAADQLPAIVVVRRFNLGGNAGPVVQARNAIVAKLTMAVDREHAGPPLAGLAAWQQEMDRQRRAAGGGQNEFLTAMVLQLDRAFQLRLPMRGRLMRSQ